MERGEINMNTYDVMRAAGVVPVVVIDDAKDAVATAKALIAGGINVMEVTMRTAAALDTIRLVKEAGLDIHVGAGDRKSVV